MNEASASPPHSNIFKVFKPQYKSMENRDHVPATKCMLESPFNRKTQNQFS